VQLEHNLYPHLTHNGSFVVMMAAVGVNGPDAYSIPFTVTWTNTTIPPLKMTFNKRTNAFTSQLYPWPAAQPTTVTISVDNAIANPCTLNTGGGSDKQFSCSTTGLAARSHTAVFTLHMEPQCNNNTTLQTGTCTGRTTITSNPIIFSIVPICSV
jgi:hypothetical protein